MCHGGRRGDTSELWVEFQRVIDAVCRQLRDRLSNIGESTSSFSLVARLAEFVCLLDLLVSVEEYSTSLMEKSRG